MEVVVALRYGPQGLLRLVLGQTDRTGVVTGIGQALAFTELGFRVGFYGWPVQAHREEHWAWNCQSREVRAGPGPVPVGLDPSADEAYQPNGA